MKFGLYSSIANPPRGEHRDRCIDEVIAEAQLAEASGFDSCFFGEHHQDHDGFLPSPLIVAAAVAARTTRLRVGTSVILLPLHHPVHVAEDVITLDLVSKGRVILGVGIGYQPADFRAFAVPMEHRAALFEESVEILRLCWAGEPFSFRGKHYTLDDVQIRPRPFQASGPPLWIGASVPAAARRAGRIADGFVGTPSTGMANATRLTDIYKEAARQAGREPEVVQMRDAWVARTRAEADAVYGPARDGGVSVLLGAPPGGVQQHAGRHAVHAGEPGPRPPDPRRSREVRAGVPALAEGHGREHLPPPPAPRPRGRAAARQDHGRDPAGRRARAAVLRGEVMGDVGLMGPARAGRAVAGHP